MLIRTTFEEAFSPELANAIMSAAEYHQNGINSQNRGSDPFKWALLIAIGYECMSDPGFARFHKIDPELWPSIKQWMKSSADLGSHDGDSDGLALLAGAYSEYMTPAEAPQ